MQFLRYHNRSWHFFNLFFWKRYIIKALSFIFVFVRNYYSIRSYFIKSSLLNRFYTQMNWIRYVNVRFWRIQKWRQWMRIFTINIFDPPHCFFISILRLNTVFTLKSYLSLRYLIWWRTRLSCWIWFRQEFTDI